MRCYGAPAHARPRRRRCPNSQSTRSRLGETMISVSTISGICFERWDILERAILNNIEIAVCLCYFHNCQYFEVEYYG